MREYFVDISRDLSNEEMIQKINDAINTMRVYGHVILSAPKRGRKINWSNANADWYSYWEEDKAGDELYLDANQLFIMGISRKKLETLLSNLDPLPLYAGSTEAKERGTFSLERIRVPPVIMRAVGKGEPVGELAGKEIAKKMAEEGKEELPNLDEFMEERFGSKSVEKKHMSEEEESDLDLQGWLGVGRMELPKPSEDEEKDE